MYLVSVNVITSDKEFACFLSKNDVERFNLTILSTNL